MGDGMQIATEVTKATTVLAQTTTVFLQAIEEAMKRFDESRSLHIMRDYIKNNEGELYAKVFDRRLISQVQHSLFYHDPPIPNAIFEDNISGKLTILFRDSDVEAVDDVFDTILKRSKGISSEKDFGKKGNDLFKVKIDNVPENEKNSIVLNAKKLDLPVSVYRNENNSYRISLPNNREKIDQIISNTYFESHGYGAHFLDYHSSERMDAIRTQAETGEKMYIVSPTNNSTFIMVDKSGFSVLKHNQPTLSVPRSQTSFQEELFTAIHDNLTVPLTFNEEQFNRFNQMSNEDKYQLIPSLSPNDEKEKKFAEIERHTQRLIGLKMSLENDPATEVNLDFLNPDVSFEQFFSLESINDQNNAEILQNNDALKGLKEYYDSLSSTEQEYFYQFLSEYSSYVDTMHDKEELDRVESVPTLDEEIAYAGAHTEDYAIDDEMSRDVLFNDSIEDV